MAAVIIVAGEARRKKRSRKSLAAASGQLDLDADGDGKISASEFHGEVEKCKDVLVMVFLFFRDLRLMFFDVFCFVLLF